MARRLRLSLPDFSGGEAAFITFNYDRSLEHFFYESLRNSFTEVPEDHIVQSLNQLRILHVYGQILPLKWQDAEVGVDYKPQQRNETLLQKAAANLRTIYEQKTSPELNEAQEFLSHAEQIFFLGFGYAPENMNVLNLPGVIPSPYCEVLGTVLDAENKEFEDIRIRFISGLKDDPLAGKNPGRLKFENMDCLKLLRNYL